VSGTRRLGSFTSSRNGARAPSTGRHPVLRRQANGVISTQSGRNDDGYTTLTPHPEDTMDARELAQALRHIAEELGGGGDVAQAVDALHDLAEEIDPGSGALLEAYLMEGDDGCDDSPDPDPTA